MTVQVELDALKTLGIQPVAKPIWGINPLARFNSMHDELLRHIYPATDGLTCDWRSAEVVFDYYPGINKRVWVGTEERDHIGQVIQMIKDKRWKTPIIYNGEGSYSHEDLMKHLVAVSAVTRAAAVPLVYAPVRAVVLDPDCTETIAKNARTVNMQCQKLPPNKVIGMIQQFIALFAPFNVGLSVQLNGGCPWSGIAPTDVPIYTADQVVTVARAVALIPKIAWFTFWSYENGSTHAALEQIRPAR